MMTTQDELKRYHEMVWRYRAELEETWPTPTVLDSLRFAVCEACEAMDAKLRENALYSRNNEKNLSTVDELADCIMMVMTAIGPPSEDIDWQRPRPYTWTDDHRIDRIISLCGETVIFYVEGADIKRLCAAICYMVEDYVRGEHESLYARLESRLDHIKSKGASR